MPRPPRTAAGGLVYHVLNRANAGRPLFETEGDYRAFLEVLTGAQHVIPMRVITYCLMPSHWHLVLWPEEDGELSDFMHRATTTHTKRWHSFRGVVGSGHLYQDRFKSFPAEDDKHYLTVVRYVERNARRAGLVQNAQDWPWSGLFQRRAGPQDIRPRLVEGPLALPGDWLAYVNEEQPERDVQAIRQCIARGRPFGGEAWVIRTARRLGIGSVLRPRGRPRKA